MGFGYKKTLPKHTRPRGFRLIRLSLSNLPNASRVLNSQREGIPQFSLCRFLSETTLNTEHFMQHKGLRIGVCSTFIFAACMVAWSASQPAATEKVLYSFTGGNDGSSPNSGLTLDHAGNLYGSTFDGGSTGNGVIYKITRSTGQQSVLYTFRGAKTDGANPSGNLTFGPGGAIFGTTTGGGTGNGVVFMLTPSGTSWTESVLHVFATGETPINSGVIFDRNGNMYGETAGGGARTDGTIYSLQHTSSAWKYILIYSFTGGTDGNFPSGGLIFDSAGNLYGTTAAGGSLNIGTVFELKRGTQGGWAESVIYTFQSTADGVNPESALTFDSSGNLYGTTVYGGDTSCGQGYGCGEVFELSPSGGVWTKTTLHAFTGPPDGHAPLAGVTFDSAGNLFGTTSNGGMTGTGALYELSPSSGGWTESVIHSFTNRNDGGYPSTPLIFDTEGNLLGTAEFGGAFTHGVVFAFKGVAAAE
jgi:uncharacterized repeat protein (TIGR03803 family)